MSLPHYKKFGWEPVVLTVDSSDQSVLQEPDLLETIPSDIRIEKVKPFSYRKLNFFGIRNIGLRAWLPLWRRGCELLEQEKFDAIFFSTTQFFVLPLGSLWKRRYNVPYIIDIQDPWLTNYYYQKGVSKPPGGWKYHITYLIAWLLEGWTYRHAAGFMSVSARYFQELQSRYSWFKEKIQTTIRFGASKEDQKYSLQLVPTQDRLPQFENNILRIVYTGAAGPIMPKALNAFFDGVQHYRETHPEKAARFRFLFLGTSYAPPDKALPSVLPIAKEWKMDDLVLEVPSRLGFLECLRYQAEADALLMLGSSDLAYSPSKLYTYYLSGPPILAPVFKNSVLEEMLQELNCARLIHIGEDGSRDVSRQEIAQFLNDALAGFTPCALPQRRDDLFAKKYLAESLTADQCCLFDAALQI